LPPRRAAAGGAADVAAAASAVDAVLALDAAAAVDAVRGGAREPTHGTLWGAAEWAAHGRADRYARVVWHWPASPLAVRLAPTLVALAAWTGVVWRRRLTVTANGLGFLASPIGLLLAFRVNACVARFHSARALWGRAQFLSRDVASTLAASADGPTRAAAARYLAAYARCAAAAATFAAADVSGLLSAADAEAVASDRKPALACLRLLRKTIIDLPLAGSHARKSAHEAVSELDAVYGAMERTLSTPVAPNFMRHYQRGLLLWLVLLPCGLLSAGCTTYPKLAGVVVSVAYLMLGIDEIGVGIEQPFAVMPVGDLANGITRDVRDALLSSS